MELAATNPMMDMMISQVAIQVAALLRVEFERLGSSTVQPALFDVQQAAVYLGRTEQAVQHLIFQKDLPVVRVRRRVHLHKVDLDAWIEKNKE